MKTGLKETFAKHEAVQKRADAELRRRYREAAIAYVDGTEIDPNDVLEICSELDKTYEEFMADAERLGQRRRDAAMDARRGEFDKEIARLQTQIQALDENHGKEMLTLREKYQANRLDLDQRLRAASSQRIESDNAATRLRDGATLDESLAERERELSNQLVLLRCQEEEFRLHLRANGHLPDGGPPTVANRLAAVRGRIRDGAPNDQNTINAKREEAALARTVAGIEKQLAEVEKRRGEINKELNAISAERLLP